MKSKKKTEQASAEKTVSLTQMPAVSPTIWAAAGLVVLVLLAYSNSFDAGFTLDNATLILKDARIHQLTGANLAAIFHHSYYWPAGEAGIYRPFTTLTFLFNYAVLGNGDNPAGYHWVNVLLHLCNVLLVYVLASRCLRGVWPGAFVAAIWAVHPVLTEAVTNIAGRADLLAGAAVLSGLLLYLKSGEATGWRRGAWLTGLLAATALGVFSKESAVMIAGVLLVFELFRWTSASAKTLSLGLLTTLPPITAMLYQRSAVFAASLPAEFPFVDNPIAGASFWLGRLTAIKVMAHYLWLLVWPARLSADYSWPEIPLADGSASDWLAWLAIAGVGASVVFLCRRSRAAWFFAGFAAVTFLPVANLLFPTGTIMAERLLYLPAIGLISCIVIGLTLAAQATNISRYAAAVFCVAIALCAGRTWSRNADWRDDLTIATSSLEASPSSYKLHKQRASALFEADSRHANIDEVTAEADHSVQLLRSLPDERNNRDAWRLAGGYHLIKGDLAGGNSPDSSGEYRKAVDLLTRAVAIDNLYRAAYRARVEAAKKRNPAVPDAPRADADLYQFLAAAYTRTGDASRALSATRQALVLLPQSPEAYRQISYMFAQYKRDDDAAVALIEGLIVTGDAALETNLLDLYESDAFVKTCAVKGEAGARVVNHSCLRVQEHFCAASADIARARLADGQPDLARKQQERGRREYGCP